MRRIRARNGRIVVVAGPVVIHTGGGRHLAELIRNGYVQALLAGNALAVHDMETNLHGTSLGVDLNRGLGFQGGHRHHLTAINTIRAAGSIKDAVDAGTVTEGVMFECVKAGVPFALAGSIRDDGPLPDTMMDLLEAQAAYARLIEGADLILMLSTMLHAHRHRQHDACGGAFGVRRHQSRRRHQARRSGQCRIHGHRHRCSDCS